MKTIMVVAALLLGSAIDAAAQSRCIVADPTATQLNVRVSPGGPRRGNMTLPNGLPVVILRVSADGRWAHVRYAASGEVIGWVFLDHLDC